MHLQVLNLPKSFMSRFLVPESSTHTTMHFIYFIHALWKESMSLVLYFDIVDRCPHMSSAQYVALEYFKHAFIQICWNPQQSSKLNTFSANTFILYCHQLYDHSQWSKYGKHPAGEGWFLQMHSHWFCWSKQAYSKKDAEQLGEFQGVELPVLKLTTKAPENGCLE